MTNMKKVLLTACALMSAGSAFADHYPGHQRHYSSRHVSAPLNYNYVEGSYKYNNLSDNAGNAISHGYDLAGSYDLYNALPIGTLYGTAHIGQDFFQNGNNDIELTGYGVAANYRLPLKDSLDFLTTVGYEVSDVEGAKAADGVVAGVGLRKQLKNCDLTAKVDYSSVVLGQREDSVIYGLNAVHNVNRDWAVSVGGEYTDIAANNAGSFYSLNAGLRYHF